MSAEARDRIVVALNALAIGLVLAFALYFRAGGA